MPSFSEICGCAVLVGFGMLEGYGFAASGVAAPSAIKSQMTFASFGMMKMFLGALGGSMLAQSAMELLGMREFEETRGFAKRGFSTEVVAGGCTLLGIGMYLAGSGPTLIPTQLGLGIETAPYVLAGALTGGVVFGLLADKLPKNTALPTCPLDKHHYSRLAIPVGTALVAASFGVERCFPAAKDYSTVLAGGLSNTILPTLAGLIVGFNQIPLRRIGHRCQGGSTAPMNIIATVTGGRLQPQHRITQLSHATQLLYVYVGTLLGAVCAVKYLGFNYIESSGVSSTASSVVGRGTTHADAFVGGMLMLIGARIAEGCTCGHGISGFSEFNPASIIGTACIFAGGMAAAAAKLSIKI